MNEETFVCLVNRACADLEPVPPPVNLMLRAGRRRRWLGSAVTVAAAAGLVAVAVAGGALLSQQHAVRPPAATTGSPSPAEPVMTAPEGTRLVGANGVVVAVPEHWGTDQVGCDNMTPIRPTVVFGHHEEGYPACAVLLDEQVPSLRIDTGRDAHAGDLDGVPTGEVDGLPARRGSTTTDRFGFVTSWIAFPEQQVRFTTTAATTGDLERILGSASRVIAGYLLVPNWYEQSVSQLRLDQMTDLVRDAGLRPLVIEVPHGWQRPGAFLRTDLPIGTPLTAGSTVTVVYAAGDLSYYATPRSLAAGGWDIGPATDFTPAVSRDHAKQIAGATGFNDDAFLRTLAYPVCPDGADCADPKSRQVWLVVDEFHYNGSGNTSHLVVVDAQTGQRLTEGTFEGTS